MTKLEYKVHSGSIEDVDIDSLIVLIYELDGTLRYPKELDRLFNEVVKKVIKSGDFSGKEGETVIVHVDHAKIRRLVLAGMGNEVDIESFRVALASVISELTKRGSVKAGIYLEGLPDSLDHTQLLIDSVIIPEMTLYDPSDYFKTEKKKISLKEIYILKKNTQVQGLVEKAKILADAINYARRIGDTPSSIMNPEGIEEEAARLAEKNGLKMKVFHREDLEKHGLNGILAVGRGGGVPPRLIILEYKGREGEEWDYAFIGKTVTFDAGGLNLKPTGYIDNMKYDKCGGAAVLGIMKAISELKLPVNVVAALPAVENLPGPDAVKPRDVIKMYNGITVEIGNTDAEGRIILADTLAYIDKHYKPNIMFDLATLTGAIVIALGNYAAGVFTGNDQVAGELYKLGLRVGERIWRMPLWKEYYEQLKSDIADTNNIGGRPAGAITAAAFLSKFVTDQNKWVHIDIAGVAWVEKGHPKKPYYKQAATGYGVRLLVSYVLENLQNK